MINREPPGLRDKPYRIITATNMTFPTHIHRTVEIVRVIDGNATIEIDGKTQTVESGHCALVLPLQYHSFHVDEKSLIKIYIFSPDYVPEFENTANNYTAVDPVFTADTSYFPDTSETEPLKIRAFFYRLCAEITDRVVFRESGNITEHDSLLDKILLFIFNNYDRDCSLQTISSHYKYDYTYVSKMFKAKTGSSYSLYLTHYRVNRACYLLMDKNDSITEICSKTGFNSIRTFNREFKKITGKTPKEYCRTVYVNE